MRPYFVRFGQRWQHFWIAGSGAPLLLLPGSPHSARSLTPLIDALSPSFLVIVPDLPGNGYSDPLSGSADQANHYASAMLTLMDELRIDQFGIYGAHSGAVIAAEVAILAGARVSGVVCDGYPLWTQDEAQSLTDDYLEVITPVASGAHLSALWSRLIDQQLYFPWFDRNARNAVDRDLSDSQRIHQLAMDYLNAGDHYTASLRSSLRADGELRLRNINEQQVRVLLLADASDVVAEHLTRVPALPNTTSVHTAGLDDRARKIGAFFRAANMTTRDPGAHLPATTRHYVQPRHHSLDAHEWLYIDIPANARTVWLHDVGQ
ncbi:MAG: alpha/beta fold hydrolase, partial [Pseudomonadales bacterium]